MEDIYDIAIIGGGFAGMSAAVYTARYKLTTVVVTEMVGGAIAETHLVENYPGIKSISGMKLMEIMKDQVESLGANLKFTRVNSVEKKDDIFVINDEVKARTLILAAGMKRRNLGVPGEEKFKGMGVSYCATCDAMFFKDRKVAVVGGSDSAAVAAMILAEHAEKVYIIYRRDKLRAEPVRVEQLEADPKVEIFTDANVIEIAGDKAVERVVLDTGREIELSGVFIEIGAFPCLDLFKGLDLKTDDSGYIIVDEVQGTSVKGVYAAGDATTASNKFRQLVTASSEGAIAANSVYGYLKHCKVGVGAD